MPLPATRTAAPDAAAARPHRATVAIGDVQGCCDGLDALVRTIDDDAAASGLPPPRLWLVGDLVNRGPGSLETLRWAVANQHRLVVVLGNHDLHLLAVATGLRRAHRSDTLDAILAAPERDALIDWLRRRPLAHLENGHLMVHAGVPPQWSAARTVELAAEVQAVLAGDRWAEFLRVMYGNEPLRWDDRLAAHDRLRFVVNALTRMRFCMTDGTMEFATKDGVEAAPPGFMPWFDVPGRASADVTVVCGHWSRIGYVARPNLLAIDTGCVWGGTLTAVRLDDRRVFTQACAPSAVPGGEPG